MRWLAFLLLVVAGHAGPSTYVARFEGEYAWPVSPAAGGVAVTSVSTVTGPRTLIYASQAYDCSMTGLYRFWCPTGTGANRIVWAGDIAKLMSAFAWIHSWGVEDNGLSAGACTIAAGTRQLRSQCGQACLWAKAVCDSMPPIGLPPIQTRIVRALTAAPPGDWFDGHVMLEAKHPDGWRLYDISAGYTYGATPLALKDALPLLPSTPRSRLCVKSFSVAQPSSGFDPSAWNFLRMTNAADLAADMERVLQIPGIDDGGYTWFYLPPGMESRGAWVLSVSPLFRILSKPDWLARFYPN